jgi:hypothetical protein
MLELSKLKIETLAFKKSEQLRAGIRATQSSFEMELQRIFNLESTFYPRNNIQNNHVLTSSSASVIRS